VEVRADALARTPDLVDRVVKQARVRGVLTRALVGKALQISPPFVITEAQLRQIVDVLDQALSAVAAEVVAK
jgi:adenosylmethionine-8-amino-7-oxononanoate aminotransferase